MIKISSYLAQRPCRLRVGSKNSASKFCLICDGNLSRCHVVFVERPKRRILREGQILLNQLFSNLLCCVSLHDNDWSYSWLTGKCARYNATTVCCYLHSYRSCWNSRSDQACGSTPGHSTQCCRPRTRCRFGQISTCRK